MARIFTAKIPPKQTTQLVYLNDPPNKKNSKQKIGFLVLTTNEVLHAGTKNNCNNC